MDIKGYNAKYCYGQGTGAESRDQPESTCWEGEGVTARTNCSKNTLLHYLAKNLASGPGGDPGAGETRVIHLHRRSRIERS